MFSAIWQDVYNLRNIAYFETNYINFDDPIYIVNNKIKKNVFENETEIYTSNYISLEKLNEIKTEYISIKNDYM